MSRVQCVGCIDAITPSCREARHVGAVEDLRVLDAEALSARMPGPRASTPLVDVEHLAVRAVADRVRARLKPRRAAARHRVQAIRRA